MSQRSPLSRRTLQSEWMMPVVIVLVFAVAAVGLRWLGRDADAGSAPASATPEARGVAAPVTPSVAPVPRETATPSPRPTPTPSPSPSASPAPSPSARYVVRAGDTLNGIAASFGVRPADIAALNNLPASGVVFVGQELLIPRPP